LPEFSPAESERRGATPGEGPQYRAARAIEQAWENYKLLRQGYRPRSGSEPALAVLDGLLDALGEIGEPLELLDLAACPPAFAEVVKARLHQREGRYADAAKAARAAITLDQYDLVAQRLALACEEGRDGLDSEVDAWLATRTCVRPLTVAETHENGMVRTCCSGWMPRPIGRLGSEGWESVWNSPEAREVRLSVAAREFAFCSRIFCPHIAGRTLPGDRVAGDDLMDGGFVPRSPRRLLLSHDRSCNLSCPSCRTEVYIASGSRGAALDRLLDETLAPLVAGAETVKLTGSGDPIASRHFRRLLERMRGPEFSGVSLELQTNGLLLTPEVWEALDLDDRVATLWISLDAATAETYSVVRRGGDWERLMRNLRFLADKRADGRLAHLRLDFVVQARNYRELPAFVEIARTHSADHISLQRIRNWGTFEPSIFAGHDVANPAHREHAPFLETLADPRLDDTRILWGNLMPARAAAKARAAARPPRRLPAREGVLFVHEGRCGSTALADLLARSDSLHVEGEIFAPTRFAQGEADAVERLFERLHAALPRRPLIEIKTFEVERLGFEWSDFLALLRSAGFTHAMLLVRNNVLRRIVSGDVAETEGRYHTPLHAFRPPALAPVDIDPLNIARRIDWFLHHRARAEAALADWAPLRLTFEDDIEEDPSPAYLSACAHLGLKPAPGARPSILRTPRYRLDDLVSDPAAIRAALAITDHAWMAEPAA
jgi:pyruvate-formate lyase-activating enzyme